MLPASYGRRPYSEHDSIATTFAGAILAALKRGKAGEVYNAVDDCPVRQSDFLQWLWEQLDRPCLLAGSPKSAPAVVGLPLTNASLTENCGEQLGCSLGFRLSVKVTWIF
jgi:hypothetical protein